MKWTWRIVWITGLALLWLFCSGIAQAGTLTDRLAQFPNWESKPAVPASQGDLAYPEWFAGNWRVTTTLVDMVAPLAPALTTPGFDSNRQFLNQPIEFDVRFVQAQPKGVAWLTSLLSNPSPTIVSDRAFNGMSLAKAYLGERAVLSVKVDPNNPNRQLTLLRGDRQLVSTVVGRATEKPDADRLITTEVFQQEFRGAPQIYFNEVENTTAYQHHPVEVAASSEPLGTLSLAIAPLLSPEPVSDQQSPEITAEQVTAIYLSPQDPDYFKAMQDNPFAEPPPIALYRYQLEFYRRLD